MNWIYVGILAGSLVTSTHSSKETCEGRGVTLKEKGVVGKCVEEPFQGLGLSTSTTTLLCSNGAGLLGPCK